MKNRMRIFSIVLAASMFGAIANHAAADPEWQGGPGYGMGGMGPGMMGGSGYGMGPGMMGGRGMMGGYGMGHGMMTLGSFRELNLNADQKAKISQISKEMRTKQWPLMGEMMDAREKLQELYDADKQDAAAIDKQYKAIEELRRNMVDNAVNAHNRINEILSKEQREKYRELRRGYGSMMRGY